MHGWKKLRLPALLYVVAASYSLVKQLCKLMQLVNLGEIRTADGKAEKNPRCAWHYNLNATAVQLL